MTAPIRLKPMRRYRVTSRAIAATPLGRKGQGGTIALIYEILLVVNRAGSRGRRSVSRRQEVLSEQVVNRVQLRDPPLERHTAEAGDLEALAIRSGLTRIRRETSVPAVERHKLLHVISKVHLVVTTQLRDRLAAAATAGSSGQAPSRS